MHTVTQRRRRDVAFRVERLAHPTDAHTRADDRVALCLLNQETGPADGPRIAGLTPEQWKVVIDFRAPCSLTTEEIAVALDRCEVALGYGPRPGRTRADVVPT